jgi:5-formyltetrahydrofolate cyclo-ligase
MRNTRTVAAYLPMGNEIDLGSLILELDALGKRIVLPRIHRSHPGRMHFLRWRPGDRLVRNRYGIDEPLADAGVVWRREIDVVLLPLLAFDAHCNRLGMGGGYYDRYFAARSERGRGLSPLLIGVAHSMQELPQLQRNPWDVALDAVITENGIRRCR